MELSLPCCTNGEMGTSVSVVTRLRVGQIQNYDLIPSGDSDLSVHHRVHVGTCVFEDPSLRDEAVGV